MIRICFSNGMGPDPCSKMVKELQNQMYYSNWIKHLENVKYKFRAGTLYQFFEQSDEDKEKQKLRPFGTKRQHGVSNISPSYLSKCFCISVENHREHLNKKMMELSGNVLKSDHSFKVPKHIMQLNGNKIFEALYTVTNEFGEIRSQMLTFDKSHYQVSESFSNFKVTNLLKSLEEGLRMMGNPAPKLFYVDDAAQSKFFLENIFPSLKQNVREVQDNSMAELELPQEVEILEITNRETAENVLELFIEFSSEYPIFVGLDCEWNVDGVAKSVALLQIAYEKKVYLIRVGFLNTHVSYVKWQLLPI